MAQLKNTLYNFNKTTAGSYEFSDFTRNKNNTIKDLFEVRDGSDYIDYYNLAENETLELVAYKLYSNENYWDILLAINGQDPLFDLYFSFEALSDFSVDKVQLYETNVYNRELPDKSKTYLAAIWEAEFLAKNDINRTIKIIKPSRMQDFMRILRDNFNLI